MTTTLSDLSPELREWVEEGLISPDQAEAIARHRERREAAAGPLVVKLGVEQRVPLLGEALGYVGATLAAVAAGILLAEYWDRMAYGLRLGVAAALTLALLGVGAVLRDAAAPAAQRLAGFAWAIAIAGAAWTVVLVTGDDGFGLRDDAIATSASLSALVVAMVLWRLRARWQQHGVTFATAEASALSLLTLMPGDASPMLYGLTFAGVGGLWLALAELHVVKPVAIGRWFGLLALLAGMRVAPTDEYVGIGLTLGLTLTIALLAGGVLAGRPLYLGFGAAAVFLFVPHAVFHFFGDTIGAPAALLVIGFVLLGLALLVVRGRRPGS